MLTREVTLHTGLMLGEERHLVVRFREETLGDELYVLGSGLQDLLAHRRIMMRRVLEIGPLKPPTHEVLGKLTRTDWDLIERAMAALDAEIAAAAGLIAPPQAAEGDGGRGEPGGAAPGDA